MIRIRHDRAAKVEDTGFRLQESCERFRALGLGFSRASKGTCQVGRVRAIEGWASMALHGPR